jgi:hypothetical protein
LHAALFHGEFRDLFMRLTEAAQGAPVLHRLVLRHRALQAIPWEALCEPSSTEGFWSTAPAIRLVRGVPSANPWIPRDIRGAVRLLVIAPGLENVAVQNLKMAVAEPMVTGDIEWLEPIVGAKASLKFLFDAIRQHKCPHILHFIGHGGLDGSGNPTLRRTDNDDGEEEWIKVESLAREIAATCADDLRLVVLEACEGARPGLFGSAAEIINRAGIDAVIAHLWPVRADVASACSRDLYRSLTAGGVTEGHVAASLANVRRSLLLHGAEAFSPVLYLRSTSAKLFNFDKRSVTPDTTPAMHATNTGAGGTQWLTGALLPIWKGGRAIPSRLRFDLRREDGSPSILEKTLDESRTYGIGRKEQRSDKKTPNDFVLPSTRVSQDAALVETVEGRWTIRNTSDKPRLLVNLVPIQPGEARTLSHGTVVVVGDVSGMFLDGRFFPIAPVSAVDPQTGFLSREGFTCEVAVALAAHKPRSLLFFQFSTTDIHRTSLAARVLHAEEPLLPIGRIESTVGLIVDNKSDMALRYAVQITNKEGATSAALAQVKQEKEAADRARSEAWKARDEAIRSRAEAQAATKVAEDSKKAAEDARKEKETAYDELDARIRNAKSLKEIEELQRDLAKRRGIVEVQPKRIGIVNIQQPPLVEYP